MANICARGTTASERQTGLATIVMTT